MLRPRRKTSKKAKRRYGKLTEANILVLIQTGEINVDVVNGVIYTRKFPTKPCYVRICHRGYRHVRIYWNGKRRQMVVHKLVWIAANQQLVPDGYEVHHGKLGKWVDGIHNLLLRDRLDHRWYHEWISSKGNRRKFRTYVEFREWKKQQPLPPEQEFD